MIWIIKILILILILILIIKSFVLSVIGYEIEMRGIPVKFEKEINSIIWDFIWDGKTNQISRNVCSLPQNKGGGNGELESLY